MEPLSLVDDPPRSPRTRVAGIAFTARVIDKLRASLPGGELHGYFAFGGFSELWSYYTGVDLAELQRTVKSATSEGEIEAWLLERTNNVDRAKINSKLEQFDTARTPESMREAFESIYPVELRDTYPLLFDLLEADDARLYGR